MRALKFLLVLCVLVSAPSVIVAQSMGQPFVEQTGWTTIQHEEGHFAARFPGAPVEARDTIDTREGEAELVMNVFEVSDDVAFLITYTDYPADASVSALMKNAKADWIKSLNGEVVSESPITKGGHEGVRFHVRNDEGAALDALLVPVDNRLYQLIVLHRGTERDRHVNTFFAAFTLAPTSGASASAE